MDSYTFLAQYYDAFMQGSDPERWLRKSREILKDRTLPAGSIADLACGTGYAAVELAKEGRSVFGVDLSEEMLEVAYERSAAEGISVRWIQADICDVRLTGKVAAAFCWNDGVNYLGSEDRLRAFLSYCFRSLEPGGVLAFDVSTPEKLSSMDGQVYYEIEDDCSYIWENLFDQDAGECRMHLAFFIRQDDGRYVRQDEEHVQHAFSRESIAAALSETGFTQISVVSFDPDGQTEPAEYRDLWTARK